jgi:hypothetical protein
MLCTSETLTRRRSSSKRLAHIPTTRAGWRAPCECRWTRRPCRPMGR